MKSALFAFLQFHTRSWLHNVIVYNCIAMVIDKKIITKDFLAKMKREQNTWETLKLREWH